MHTQSAHMLLEKISAVRAESFLTFANGVPNATLIGTIPSQAGRPHRSDETGSRHEVLVGEPEADLRQGC